METIDNEEWRPVVGYPDYEVSSLGSVKRLARPIEPWMTLSTIRRLAHEKLLTPLKHVQGYLMVNLSKGGVQKMFTIHSLVMRAFVGEPPIGMEIDHLNGKPWVNTLSNLEYVSHTENVHRGKAYIHTNIICESVDGKYKTIYKDIADAVNDGYSDWGLYSCLNGRQKTHKGMTFRVEDK